MPGLLTKRRRLGRAAGLGLAAGLLLLSVLVYSPWHRHDPLAGQACSLCHFGHLSSPEPTHQVQLPAPTFQAWLHLEQQPQLVRSADLDCEYGRAPPA